MTFLVRKTTSLCEKSITTLELLLGLVLIYLPITFIKTFFVLKIPSPFIFSDETAYAKMAQSFFESKTFSLWGSPAGYPSPLYSVILSIAYAFGDITAAYPVMKIINAFISSLIIIPVFLIAKEFLTNKKSLYVAFLSSILPASFSFTSTLISENLFYPLFMFSLFFMLKSISENDKRWDILCGLFIGLSILTRLHGLVLLSTLLFVLLVIGLQTILSGDDVTITTKIWKVFRVFIDKWSIFLSSAVVMLPWFLRNGYYFGFTLRGLTGGSIGMAGGLAKFGGSQPTNIPLVDFIYWALMHTGYFVFATGIIFFALTMLQTRKVAKQGILNKEDKNTKLGAFIVISWISFFMLVSYCAYQKFHGGPYLMGRYIDPILPAFIIMGAIGLDSFNHRDFRSLFGTLLVCSCALVFVPINSLIRAYSSPDAFILLVPQRLYEMGVLSSEPNVILIKMFLVVLPILFFLILAKKDVLRWKYIALLLLIFFIAGSALASGVMYTASTDALDEMAIGLWLHEHVPKNSMILFDERDADRMKWAWWGTMFWTDNLIKIGGVSVVEAEYIVSLHKLDLPVVLEVNTTTEVIQSYDNHYFVYKTKQ